MPTSPHRQKTADRTEPECPASLDAHSPVTAFQIFAVSSSHTVSTDAPSLENTADVTAAIVNTHSPVATFQIFATLSWDTVSTNAPSLENTAAHTTRKCPTSVNTHLPVAAFQIFAVLPKQF